MNKKSAFTLAEILITISVIGLVAIMVIPRVVKNYTYMTWGTARNLFETKVYEGMRQMRANDAISGYATTDKFVDEFSKYMSISKRCDTQSLSKCFPEEFKNYQNKTVSVSNLKTGPDIGKDLFTSNNVGVIFTNGLSAIISYNPNCQRLEPYASDKLHESSACLAMIFDVNAYAKPNKEDEDIFTFGGAKVLVP